jgi:hypothetical protein
MALQFLTPTRAKLIDVNPRSEKHGPDELVPAIDLRFQLDIDYELLAALDSRLPQWVYEEQLQQPTTEGQEELPGIDAPPPVRVAVLRFPQVGQPFKWEDESEGYTLTVDYGIGGESNTVLGPCKVHKHSITAREGGTCTVAFTCSCATGLTEHDVGRMGTRVQQDAFICLVANPIPLAQPEPAAA